MGQLREMGGERHKRDSSSVEVLTKGHGRGGASPELPVSDSTTETTSSYREQPQQAGHRPGIKSQC